MNTKKTTFEYSALELLKQRVAGNYANFKADVLTMDDESIYDMAHRIAVVKDAYEQITGDGMDYMDEGEVEFLLKFYDPLEMVADYMEQSMSSEYPVDIDEAFCELLNDDNAGEKYLTMRFAEKLTDKYGEDMGIEIALLQETIEAGDRYVRLMKLTDLYDHEAYPHHDIPLKPYGSVLDFDDDGFNVYEEDDEEGCF